MREEFMRKGIKNQVCSIISTLIFMNNKCSNDLCPSKNRKKNQKTGEQKA